jgi:tetratricopeptide (TPR) repeat protein
MQMTTEVLISAEAYNQRGMAKAEAEDYLGAIADYTEAIALDSNFAEAYYNRAYDRSEVRDYQGAIEDYTKVIELVPDDAAAAYFNRGMAKAKLGDADGAMSDCQLAESIAVQCEA